MLKYSKAHFLVIPLILLVALIFLWLPVNLSAQGVWSPGWVYRQTNLPLVYFITQGSAPTCPASGGQLYYDGSDLNFCENGGAYTVVNTGGTATMGIGGTVTSGTAGSVLFINAGPILAQDKSNFFFDDSNNQLLMGAGSNSAPSLACGGDPNTGIYNIGTDQCAITTGGTARFNVTNSGADVASGVLTVLDGAVGTPAYTFSGDTDTGLYHTANTVLIASAGVNRASFAAQNQSITAGNTTTTAGSITLTGGTPSSSGVGGPVNLTAGNGASASAGGPINLLTGAGAGGAAGGAVVVDISGGTDEWTFDGTGNLVQNQSGLHINQADSSSDLAGTIALSAATSASYTFATAFANAPSCVITPIADPGAGIRWWVTTSTSAVTANVDSASTLTFNFHCTGNPN